MLTFSTCRFQTKIFEISSFLAVIANTKLWSKTKIDNTCNTFIADTPGYLDISKVITVCASGKLSGRVRFKTGLRLFISFN